MKYFFLALTLFFSQTAFSGSGKTIIPTWESNHAAFFYVTNITNNPISVNLKLYDRDGNVINLLDWGYKESFIVDPKATNKFSIKAPRSNRAEWGFGTVSWENQSGDDEVALIMYTSNIVYDNKVAVNGGKPF
ncbi:MULTISPECIES: hypothetical protein [unclassified Vibrio]|uniref:hypothetical protein n=1 Tax=Vibrio TaxID=662 RepID=UPI0020757023|nr:MULTISPECIES: hypothetical protein [unclassified Vibrio]MDK9777247.1 hypothetical protein [Vibrio sp. D401a]MDK9801348.1 hypothetical protein [Vibrio sp. D406a]USD52751.1 hypothetical protein J4N37_17965 [Vibrio sp. SCSIO 43153]